MESTKPYTDGMKTKDKHVNAELLKKFSSRGIKINSTLLKLYKKLSVFVSLILITSSIHAQTELKNFTASFTGQKVKLIWETASENNSNYFSIERSWNGKNFETVGLIKASVNSSATAKYFFYDKDYYSNVIYYRLSITDKIGNNKMLGSIVGVQLKEDVKEISIYPIINLPGAVYIDVSMLNSHDVIVDATDDEGQKVVSRMFEKSVFNSAIELQTLNMLTHGNYQLTAFFDTRVLKTKLKVSDVSSNVTENAIVKETLFTLK